MDSRVLFCLGFVAFVSAQTRSPSGWNTDMQNLMQTLMSKFKNRPRGGTTSVRITFSDNGARIDSETTHSGGFDQHRMLRDPFGGFFRTWTTNRVRNSYRPRRPFLQPSGHSERHEYSVPTTQVPPAQDYQPNEQPTTTQEYQPKREPTPKTEYKPKAPKREPAPKKEATHTKPSRSGGFDEDTYCSERYKKIKGHTLCLPDDSRLYKAGVSEADKRFITDMHNYYRSTVEPPATDLVKLVWDDRVAAVAQRWASQCKAAHDKGDHRKLHSIGMSVGQNVAGGYRTWNDSMFHWWDEIKLWNYGEDHDRRLGANSFLKIGHFTQMAQNGTYLLGCGYAECEHSQYTRYYVCDYAAGQSDLSRPYTKAYGSQGRCSACPDSCVRGQCDCKGKVCYNGGTLEPNKCQCKCTKLYAGPTCEKLVCPEKEDWICGKHWKKESCEQYVNVPEKCPYLCGICESPYYTKMYSQPTVTVISPFGCKYTGHRPTTEECKTYGNKGQDTFACQSSPRPRRGYQQQQFGCSACEQFFNIPKDYCPVMCGLCDPQCNGKQCQNGGTLDTTTCECTCKKPYYGKNCERVDCSKKDKRFCESWSPSIARARCKMYDNVPGECPRTCGLC